MQIFKKIIMILSTIMYCILCLRSFAFYIYELCEASDFIRRNLNQLGRPLRDLFDINEYSILLYAFCLVTGISAFFILAIIYRKCKKGYYIPFLVSVIPNIAVYPLMMITARVRGYLPDIVYIFIFTVFLTMMVLSLASGGYAIFMLVRYFKNKA
ncbi:MAG: hypothetical protein E7573_02365 [Ruminococcaceae bacterium]|nr:hypothetical protein [Oscillospiraceae bacterium]MBR3596228.1 hypothetical protein [Clostridia bacterium]